MCQSLWVGEAVQEAQHGDQWSSLLQVRWANPGSMSEHTFNIFQPWARLSGKTHENKSTVRKAWHVAATKCHARCSNPKLNVHPFVLTRSRGLQEAVRAAHDQDREEDCAPRWWVPGCAGALFPVFNECFCESVCLDISACYRSEGGKR